MRKALIAVLTVSALAGCGGGHGANSGTPQQSCAAALRVGAPVQADGVVCRESNGRTDVEGSATVKCDDGRTLVTVSEFSGFVGGTWKRGTVNC